MPDPRFDNDHPLAQQFRDLVKNPEFPCVGAKSALANGRMDVLVAHDITSAWNDLQIHTDLLEIGKRFRADRQLFRTFVVLFECRRELDEAAFEHHLWARTQSISDKDVWLGQHAAPSVSHDPHDVHFSLSFGGEAFFLVGLHPQASRPARRFPMPALVFNLHEQFEMLRASGRYEKLRSAIIERDVALSGTPNPMLARHGHTSEARQYSGREVGTDWQCPYRRAESEATDPLIAALQAG